jgi:hypothetical protein
MPINSLHREFLELALTIFIQQMVTIVLPRLYDPSALTPVRFETVSVDSHVFIGAVTKLSALGINHLMIPCAARHKHWYVLWLLQACKYALLHLRPRDRGSSTGRVKNLLFSTSSRPALGSTQPHIQWVPGALSSGVKRQEREADHWPPASAEVKKMWI